MSVQKQEDKPQTKHHQYDGSRLRSDIGAMLTHPAVAKKLELTPKQIKANEQKLAKTLGQEKPKRVEERPIATPIAKKVVVPIRPQRIGYKKLIITIPEDLARTILNYAGHSASKQATIQVWYAVDREPQVDTDPNTVSPVYPLFNL